VERLAASPGLILAPLATAAASRASRPIAPPGNGPAHRRHVEGRDTPPAPSASRFAVEERLAGLAGLDSGVARHRGGVEVDARASLRRSPTATRQPISPSPGWRRDCPSPESGIESESAK
jgi:hypothetical protein